MIVVDTNVLSEPLKRTPDHRVVEWLAHHNDECAITAVTIGELLMGVRTLPHGRHKESLAAAGGGVLEAFPFRVLPYDATAARQYAVFQEVRRARGRPLATEDGMIAAIAAVTRATLATRNVGDFEHLDIDVIDPWVAP